MKLQEGVQLHFIPAEKFTTNQILVRFTAPMDAKTVAGRVLVSNILDTANQVYPTSHLFHQRLADLYGAQFSTSVSRRGKVHSIDLKISYVKSNYLPDGLDLTLPLLDFLYASIFQPLRTKNGFDPKLFEVEKTNLLNDLDAEIEDHFYHADVELAALFFEDEHLKIPRIGKRDLVEKETAQTVYKALQSMIHLDRIDFFISGEVDKKMVIKRLKEFRFSYRNPKLEFTYQPPYSNIVREKMERKEAVQSILELAYHLQISYNDVNHIPLIVFNGLFGAFAHSKLFTDVREKEGLAYTIGSQLNIFTGLLKVYAGIDKENRKKTMRLISKQLLDMKRGYFTDERLEQTKKMLIHSAILSQDKQGQLIEQTYNKIIFGDDQLDLPEWIDAVNKVSREDVSRAAKLVRLQAIYFMEGVL
ncbi:MULTISPECIES: EF-P 5-aminopentanol modification-associated protein YfmF [unclassified Streptococcus]|uniref:EF-P 5-aminopentanol modification-associated protein YfmF n=1 Tax=unclassified Streptococcus TaxID=2608887 RepID=UPI0010716CCD|nr:MULTISPECIES: pitrilysin family protein [unclassified Streptococcus]MBF0786923.1 insulinase family protein [Streptococcus sp. 19428wC2_LYSM12]MCQ9211469.1 insulinase family protein [Streptococcus sp. B01]MCQ9214785.1 insulinase family protein [Streptococcus sp. O1]TFV06125.1 insulinase family protein [Streptococcus sp. LYSM12]